MATREARPEPTIFDEDERDGWFCQICGIETLRSLRGSYDDRAPELDHIVPMSKGGPHSYTNTQCSCRRCNGLKSDQAGVISVAA